MWPIILFMASHTTSFSHTEMIYKIFFKLSVQEEDNLVHCELKATDHL